MILAPLFESHSTPLPAFAEFLDKENNTNLLSEFCEIQFHYDNLNMGYPPTEPRTFVFGLALNRLSTGRAGTD
ncbi:MAG: hypothetical protein WAK31_19880 [Chthoniobacterales bacterium]